MSYPSGQGYQCQPQYSTDAKSQAPGQQQMLSYGQQPALPQQQQQWQNSGEATAGQQASTTSQTVTTTTYAGYGMQQQAVPYQHAPASQPAYHQYAQDQSAFQYQRHPAAQAVQYQAAPGHYQSAQDQSAYQCQLQPATPAAQKANYDRLKMAPPPEKPRAKQSVSQSMTTTTTKQTMQYKGCNASGQARKAAEANGQAQQFEQKVQTMIASLGVCPASFQWYTVEDAYLCAGGNHAILHTEIDAWISDPAYMPQVMLVNSFFEPCAPIDPRSGLPIFFSCHPPDVDFWQPMHMQHREFVQQSAAIGYAPRTKDRICPCYKALDVGTVAEMEARGSKVLQAQMAGMGYGGGDGWCPGYGVGFGGGGFGGFGF